MAELRRVFPGAAVTPLSHPRQRNLTFILELPGLRAVAKCYRGIDVADMDAIAMGEILVGAAGVPVPRVIYRSENLPLTVYKQVMGCHSTDYTYDRAVAGANHFVRSVVALDGFVPTWAPPRPLTLPERARLAVAATKDAALRDTIESAWVKLSRLAMIGKLYACHTDWRADNMLFRGGQLAAALDWESLVLLPFAEAAGYAAGSLTHSWRAELVRPIALEPAETFMTVAQRQAGDHCILCPDSHMRLACLLTCAIRLVEDRLRCEEAISLHALRAAFGA
ncbi:MAG: phosphotransferase [Egibacteraceae bacterium]